MHALDKSLDETQVLATASFPLQFGNQMLECTNSARLGAGQNPAMELSLQVNPVTGASAVSIMLERSRRDGDYLYVKKDGEKVPVKLDLRYVGTEGSESRRLCAADGETTIENKDGLRGGVRDDRAQEMAAWCCRCRPGARGSRRSGAPPSRPPGIAPVASRISSAVTGRCFCRCASKTTRPRRWRSKRLSGRPCV